MNKRIRDLIEQATESKGFLTAGDSVPPLTVREFNKEKFAELIVQDCIDILSGYRGKVTFLNEEVGHQHPIYVIQQHFGIKQ